MLLLSIVILCAKEMKIFENKERKVTFFLISSFYKKRSLFFTWTARLEATTRCREWRSKCAVPLCLSEPVKEQNEEQGKDDDPHPKDNPADSFSFFSIHKSSSV